MSEIRKEEAIRLVTKYNVDVAAEMMGITRQTVQRYVRKDRRAAARAGIEIPPAEIQEQGFKLDPVLARINERYSPTELKLLANGGMPMEYSHQPVHNFDGETIKIGYITDTHIGSVYTDYEMIREAREVMARNKCEMIVHAGDVTEGLSNRPGHMYECTELGYDAQKERAIDLMGKFDFAPMYMIDGNHDRWFIKSAGGKIVKDICDHIENATFIGHDEGNIMLSENVQLRLWHGEDGSSYAISYRLQKILESLSGGDKPSIMICGHVHKFGHFFMRNVHCVSGGCIQKQTKWMRGKRLEAHPGFGIMDVTINETGVASFKNEFFPFYT
jgi:predicted phosphodiesterase